MKRCTHRVLRYVSHKRGSQDGAVCVKCRAFWKRTRCYQCQAGSALVRA